MIRPYLKDMIGDHKAKTEWKIQLSMRIIFVSVIDSNETRETHTKSDNMIIMSGIETFNINDLLTLFVKDIKED